MPDRVMQIFADAQQASEATRWQAFCRKIEKTAWAIADHKKAEAAAIAAGAAISITVGVLTGGLSLAVQFGVGLALGLGNRTIGRLAGYGNYEANKAALETAMGDTAGREDRKSVRLAYKNFQYNEGYFQDSLYGVINAFRGLQACAQKPITSEADLQAMIYNFIVFKDEYERALHYFFQYERFVEYEAKFLTAAANAYNIKYEEYRAAIEQTVRQNRAWHRATCRKSRVKTDICYGLNNTDAEIPNSAAGNPHHRMV